MEFISLAIPDVVLIKHRQYADERGSFMELFRQQEFAAYFGGHGVDGSRDIFFVQDNLSRSCRGVLRGLHYQVERPQGKLVQVISGTIFDVAVDLRPGSGSYGQWVGQYLDADEPMSLWIPPGFAHGFYVTSEESTVLYKCTDYYCPEYERTLNWADPELAIAWPLMENIPLVLSDKDRQAPFYSLSKLIRK
ncbi:dTDP-4-dehydrorhamnose 3,5-epimerase [Aeromonas caviae]|uniref:dTDP-4-dehydrorhamnose 3,5-epimerase n=1 Tax=Aeromonas TaxID=642 RepID=UPI00191F9878|nr:dTDP-4-dehydrorhamnose 3,5-epimerase [Aeromonas caviae]MBL0438287.1 dTDP-4-dehydrorhamnose 3,5-epimerase [Aeromonas caviae]MBL0582962.1 dTDP-4-dehydrorhamnose 3,5-epimerase [Aeromonas caviae]MDX7730657.1 dTDP-4-dehydrorhamnose 3,5-epimerase [Aeromonas caviae]USP61103.1 dTDP-4-dehydrorhamnose 3,5-epimerase [Aeromonas caviae]GKR01033.1 dTDP-4-dehydrorhamnose 3,5-epimerase [Aeromonas caviae]